MNKLLRLHRLLAVAGCLCLLFSKPVLSSTDAAVPSPSAATPAAVADAQTLIRNGRFDDALSVLRPMVQGGPVEADLLFQFGLAAVAVSQNSGYSEPERTALLDEGIGAFHAMLVARPELVRVRLELARALFLKGDDNLAASHFKQVLAGDLPGAVVANVQDYLARIRARDRWSASVGMALAPNTNIGARSEKETIYIFGLPFQQDTEDPTTSGVGLSLWASGEYQHPLSERYRLRAGGDLSLQQYAGSQFDHTTVSGHVGPRWLVSRTSEGSLLASVRRNWRAGDTDYRELGLRSEFKKELDSRTMATLRVSWHDRRYHDRSYLDGPVLDVVGSTHWMATPTLRLEAGYGWGRERTKVEKWRQIRFHVQAGVKVVLPRGFTVGGSGTLRWSDFGGSWFPYTKYGETRRDLTRTLRLSIHNRAVAVGGFSPQITLGVEKRTTNAQLHDYDRNFAEISLVQVF